jgi:hypothetical protein
MDRVRCPALPGGQMKPEKKFEDDVIKELQKRGWFAHHFDAVGVDGWPDILALRGNQQRLIELKAGSKIRKEQLALKQRLWSGYYIPVYLIENVKGLYALDGCLYSQISDVLKVVLDEG